MWIYTLKLISTSVDTEDAGNALQTSGELKKKTKWKTLQKIFLKSELFYKTRGIKYGQYNNNTAILVKEMVPGALASCQWPHLVSQFFLKPTLQSK